MAINNLGLEPWGYQIKSTDADLIGPKSLRITYQDFSKKIEGLDLNVQLKETLHCIVQWRYWIRKTEGLKQHKKSNYGAAKSIQDKLIVRLADRKVRFSRNDLRKACKVLYDLGYITNLETKPYEPGHDNTVKNPDMYEIIIIDLNLTKIVGDGTTDGLF